MVPEIWSVTDKTFLILDHFLPFYSPSPNISENQNFEKIIKKKKKAWRYNNFPQVYHK